MKSNSIKKWQALASFDLSRVKVWLMIWWGCCLLQALLAVALINGHADSLIEPITLGLYPANFLFITILVGAVLRPCRPGSQKSYFQGLAVSPTTLLLSRLLWIILAILLPLYLARLVPLFIIAPELGSLSAYTVFYWGIHLGFVACAGAIATASKKTSTYLLSVFLSAVGLAVIVGLTSQLSFRESNWIRVASPQGAELLWRSGLSFIGALGFALVIRSLYRGRHSWKLGLTAVTLAVIIAALWKPIRFISDWKSLGHEVPSELVDVSQLNFETERSNGYYGQLNSKPGHYSGGSRSTPPYYDGVDEWNTNKEHFWFISGSLTVQNLDPKLAFTARLLEARWIAPDGEVLPYAPPSGTYSVTNSC